MAVDGYLNFLTKINTKGFENGTDSIAGSLDKLKSQLKGVAAAVGLAFGVKEIVSFSKEAKEAWNVQLEAETKLERIMKNTMGATREQIQATKDWAAELQQIGVIGDEIQLSGLQELSTYVENADSLKTMNVVLNDMLAQQYGLNATAESAVSISTMLGKVLEGQTSALSRYGYSFTEAQEKLLKYGTEEQKVATLAEVVEASVGGMNEALAKTPAGRLKQVSNNMGDVKEQFGQAVTNIQAMFLPALERLSSALAKVASLAVSVSQSLAAAFGVELDNSAAIASNISQSVASQNDLTDAALETAKAQEKSVAGFDEINKLAESSKSSDADSSSGMAAIIPVKPDADENEAVKALNKLSDKLQTLIDPIRIAWDVNSPQLIANAKTALNNIKNLTGSISKSLEEVWTNGSGERFAGNLLILFSDILGIIGDISESLDTAWNDSGRGTALIQSYFDRWNALYGLIHEVADSFRTVWNSGAGVAVLENIFSIITNINNVTSGLRTGFADAWRENDNGIHIFEGVFGILNAVLGTISKIIEDTAEWSRTIDFSPLLESIAELLAAIEPLTANIGEGLEWLYSNVLLPLASMAIEDVVPAFLNTLSAAIKLCNAVIKKIKPLAKWLIDKFLKPIAEWTGGIIVDVLGKFADKLEAIAGIISGDLSFKDVISDLGALEIIFISVASAIGLVLGANAIAGLLAQLPVLLSSILTQTSALIANAAAWAAANIPIIAVTAAIAAVIAIGALLIKHWDDIKEFALGVWDSIQQALWDFFDNVVEIFNDVSEFLSEIWEEITETFSDAWDGIKEIFSKAGDWFSDRWNDIKRVFSAVGTWFGNIFRTAWNNIKSVFAKPGEFFSEVWEGIKSCFSHVTSWFRDTFSKAWQAVKDVFSTGGQIFTGIAESIADVFKGVVNSLIDGINWVIAQPFNAINSALDGIRDVKILKFEPFSWLPSISIPEIPHLAQGTVVPANYGNFLAVLGDNKREAEVVSPISTIKKAVAEAMSENGGNAPKEIVLYTYLFPNSTAFHREVIRIVNSENSRRGG